MYLLYATTGICDRIDALEALVARGAISLHHHTSTIIIYWELTEPWQLNTKLRLARIVPQDQAGARDLKRTRLKSWPVTASQWLVPQYADPQKTCALRH